MASVILMVTPGNTVPQNAMHYTQSCLRSPVAITVQLTTRFIMNVLSANTGKSFILLLSPLVTPASSAVGLCLWYWELN